LFRLGHLIEDFAGGFRRRQWRTVSTLLPTEAAISTAFNPAAAPGTILARHTTLCGVFRSRTRRSKRSRSASLIDIRSIFLIGADSQVCVSF